MASQLGKLFVARLPWSVNKEMLKSYFSKYGEVSDSFVVIDRSTGRSKGYGFVTFANPAVSDSVMEAQHEIDGRVVIVSKARTKEDKERPLEG